jgi:yrdC domain.
MIETVCNRVEVLTLCNNSDVKVAADAIIDGKIALIRLGSVFSFVANPYISGLTEDLCFLKEREGSQLMSTVCTYEQAKKLVDPTRVNQDFFSLSASMFGRMIARIPIDPTLELPLQYNKADATMQLISFEGTHPLRNALREELVSRGCEYLNITSGNIHGAPTIGDTEAAKMLAVAFNIKADFLGMKDFETIVIDIAGDIGEHEGSYTIISFCNPDAIEIKRLVNKTDRELTDSHIESLFANIPLKTPIVYAL